MLSVYIYFKKKTNCLYSPKRRNYHQLKPLKKKINRGGQSCSMPTLL